MLTADTGSHIRTRLDALLSATSSRDFAIAYSGGGDSTALLQALREHGNCKAVFIVDHALRKESGKEAKAALKFAKELGFDATILTWAHNDPETGLQEKARKARYRLIGNACRAKRIFNIVTAHTRDDQAETLLMRYDKGTDWRGAAGMSEVTFAPLWPELAGMTVLRPALSISRAVLRGYNQTNGLKWAEDPSNANLEFARIRARQYLMTRPALTGELSDTAAHLSKGRDDEKARWRSFAQTHFSVDENGIIHISKRLPPRLLSLCLQVVSGSGASIKSGRVQALSDKLASPEFSGATLGGAHVTPHRLGWIIVRDPGALVGRPGHVGIKPVASPAGTMLWDGRFWIKCELDDVTIEPLARVYNRLTPEQKQALRQVPAAGRDTLPAMLIGRHIMAVGVVISHPDITIKSAVREHLEGRLGGPLN